MTTDFLFAQPSFMEGLARLLDVGGLYDSYNERPTPEEADCIAIYNDWKAVGDDIRQAMAQFAADNRID